MDGALYVPDAQSILENVHALLKAASDRRITTVSSCCAHEENDPEFAVFPPHCLDGTRGAARIFPDLPQLPRREIPVDAAPDQTRELTQATHFVVKKKVYDLFSNRWLDALRRSGAFAAETCVVFGVAIDYCVRSVGLGLAEGGARVQLVTDATRGIVPGTTAQTLEDLRAVGVEFVTTAEVLESVARMTKEAPGTR